MKNILTAAALLSIAALAAAPRTCNLASPDGRLSVVVTCDKTLTWQVSVAGETALETSPLSMTLGDGTVWGANPQLSKASTGKIDRSVPSPFYKRAQVTDRCNTLTLTFKGGYGVELRAWDDAVAYRFVSTLKGNITVAAEQAEFNFAGDLEATVPYVYRKGNSIESQFFNSFENHYTRGPLSKLDRERLIFLPAIVTLASGCRVCITEADLESYPGMYLLNSDGGNALRGVFAPCPKKTVVGGYNRLQGVVEERENYIAKVSGNRAFPWRAMIIAENDKQLADNDAVYRMASPSRLADVSWIRPGKVAWDWWNDWGIYGVDFKAGVNTATYKYYIDFAAERGVEYVILDEGWSVRGATDLMRVVPEIDLPEIVRYGREKGVGIILWAGCAAFDKDMENVCRHFADMGVKGFKVDFMDRDDQQMVDFIYKAASTAARYRLLLDFHGMYKPTGLQRTWPNVINFEGVAGCEQNKWTPVDRADQVVYDVLIPFIRMVAGPMDYTQGAMLNATRSSFRPSRSEPMSPGTRCRQLAMYVIFESPLNMMCDSPVKYRSEEECTRLITSFPTVWDETVALDGRMGEYVALARRKGDVWYVGAMTDWKARTMTLELPLPEGRYEVELFRDGANAAKYAQDYKREVFTLAPDRQLRVEMAPGGGFAAVVREVKQTEKQ
ncbi:MAG: glycoside hydrolase family 97 protein [Rikenellaceae bacterium]|jgi:alpha-glucosidase|nr:glycoside hydrolase family 97 protein [Rikenellaceae bacterium]